MTCKTCGGLGLVEPTADLGDGAMMVAPGYSQPCPDCAPKTAEAPDLIERARSASVVEIGAGNICEATDLGDLLADAIEARDAEIARLREALEEVHGCFSAAETEGLSRVLTEQQNTDLCSLYDLVTRRLLFADRAAVAALALEYPSSPPRKGREPKP
jgi:hypothetical protein